MAYDEMNVPWSVVVSVEEIEQFARWAIARDLRCIISYKRLE